MTKTLILLYLLALHGSIRLFNGVLRRPILFDRSGTERTFQIVSYWHSKFITSIFWHINKQNGKITQEQAKL